VSDAGLDTRLGAFREVRAARAGEEVLAALLDAIRGGLYAPGEKLPTQHELAAGMGVSRGVVREAIEVLRQAGIVSVKRGKGGTVVASLEHVDDVLVRLRGEAHLALRAVLETRRALEQPAARLAAARARKSSWKVLRELVARLEDEPDEPRAFVRTDAAFHAAMAELSGNAMLAGFLRTTLDEVIARSSQLPVGQIDTREALAMQHELLAALVSRDPAQVDAAIDDHLAPLEQALLGERLRVP
jgi:GntR family transcriptional regulator, transcriptional repressor for pyruvate dehydrogenase complex